MRLRVALEWICGIVATIPALSASATVVQGTVTIPTGFATEVDTTPSMWLLENGLVPIQPPLQDPRTNMVVLLEGARAGSSRPSEVSAHLRDMRLDPRVIAVQVGAAVNFKNDDRVVHALYAVDDSRFAAQPQAPGGTRTHRFDRAGPVEIRCKEVPHVRGTVLVLPTDRFAPVQSGGTFRIADVPPGKYALRVWYAGDWLYDKGVEVGAAGPPLSLEVKLAARKSAGSND